MDNNGNSFDNNGDGLYARTPHSSAAPSQSPASASAPAAKPPRGFKALLRKRLERIKTLINKNRKLAAVIAVILAAALLLGILGGAYACASCGSRAASTDDRTFALLDFRFTDRAVTDTATAISAAKEGAGMLGLDNAGSELSEANVNTFAGDTYYRLQQRYNGVPVFGRTAIVAADENGTALSLSSNLADISDDISLTPTISSETAVKTVQNAVGGDGAVCALSTVVYSLYRVEPTLCWQILSEGADGAYYYFVSAQTGDIIASQCLTFTDAMATGGGKDVDGNEKTFNTTLREDGTYLLWDQERNIQVHNANGGTPRWQVVYAQNDNVVFYFDREDSEWHNSDGEVIDTSEYTFSGSHPSMTVYDRDYNVVANEVYIAYRLYAGGALQKVWDICAVESESGTWEDNKAVTAISRVSACYDFFRDVLGREGYNGERGEMIVAYGDEIKNDENNALSSSGNALTLLSFGGDNTMSLDVAAHEYTHCVERTISAMAYEGESGAIMEALSDIFGELVEDWENDGLDNDCDWIHGKRSMMEPTRNKYPDTYLGRHWKDTSDPKDSNDHGGVHTNNTVLSHAAYLMCAAELDGTALSTGQLAKLLYSTMFMLPGDCTFEQFRYCVEATAKIMLKNGELSDGNVERISAAFDEVDVGQRIPAYKVKPGAELIVYCADGSVCSTYAVCLVDPQNTAQISYESTTTGEYSLPETLPAGEYVVLLASCGEAIARFKLEITSDSGAKESLSIDTSLIMPPAAAVSSGDATGDNSGDELALRNYLFGELAQSIGLSDLAPFVVYDGSYGYEVPEKTRGIVSYIIKDFDSDGKTEMVVFVLDENGVFEPRLYRADGGSVAYVPSDLSQSCVSAPNGGGFDITLNEGYIVLNGHYIVPPGYSRYGTYTYIYAVTQNGISCLHQYRFGRGPGWLSGKDDAIGRVFFESNDEFAYMDYDYQAERDALIKDLDELGIRYSGVEVGWPEDEGLAYGANIDFEPSDICLDVDTDSAAYDAVMCVMTDFSGLQKGVGESGDANQTVNEPTNSSNEGGDGRWAAYLQAIESIISKYGEGRLVDDESRYVGLSTVRLIDFDNDGSEELFCAYNTENDGSLSTNKYIVYGYSDRLIGLLPELEISTFGTDYSPGSRFFRKEGITYLLVCPANTSMSFNGAYVTLENDRMITAFSYCIEDYELNSSRRKINDMYVDEETYDRECEGFLKDGVYTDIEYAYRFSEGWIDDSYYSFGIHPDDINVTNNTIEFIRSKVNGGR